MAPVSNRTLLFQLNFLSFIIVQIETSKTKKKREFWVRKLFLERKRYGLASSLVPELRQYDRHYFFEFLRLPVDVFAALLRMVEPGIKKQNTRWRESISAHDRLCVTLRFLATGETFRSLSYSFRMGRTTVTNIVRETCKEIWLCLREKYCKTPTTQREWLDVAEGFSSRWQLPHCCGTIDGKHILIECPPNSASMDYCYKGFFSKILMAVADSQYRFLFFEFGFCGSESDGGVFQKCSFGKKILNDSINIPPINFLPKSKTPFPYFFVADEAFPLLHNLMRPYSRQSELTKEQKIYNYRLCRARRVVENAFGILAARFRMFYRPLNFDTKETLPVIVAAAIALHNYLITECSESYCPKGFADVEKNGKIEPGKWRDETMMFKNLGKQGTNTYSKKVKKIREKLSNYLNKEGAVEWQDRHI